MKKLVPVTKISEIPGFPDPREMPEIWVVPKNAPMPTNHHDAFLPTGAGTSTGGDWVGGMRHGSNPVKVWDNSTVWDVYY